MLGRARRGPTDHSWVGWVCARLSPDRPNLRLTGRCIVRPVIRLLASICCTLVALHAPPAEARRVALVIGNAAYKIGPLANPLNDATAVAQAFETQLKFDKVILKTNLG